MQISSEEAYDLLSPYVREHRRARCIFQAPQARLGFSGFLWGITEDVLTLQRLPSLETAREVHVPLNDADFAVCSPADAPAEMQPEAPLDRFDRVLQVEQVRFEENGAPVELRWAVWIAARHAWAEEI